MKKYQHETKSSINLWGNLRYRRPFIIAIIVIIASLTIAYLIFGKYAWLGAIIIISVISFLCIIIYTVINNTQQQQSQDDKIDKLQKEVNRLKNDHDN